MGLRESKRRLTRQALQEAAFEFFAAQGYENTTVDAIAAKAQISRATFFRCFDSKEDVFGGDDEARRRLFFDALHARPRQEPVLVAVRNAVHACLIEMDAQARERGAVYTRAMAGSRSLLGRAYEIRLGWIRELELWIRSRGRRVHPP